VNLRIGQGYDSHRLEKGRKLILGGVHIPFEYGLSGHSDADVLVHAVTDALIGALGLGDIGKHFPDTSNMWKDTDSIGLLKQIVEKADSMGFRVSWLDSTIVAEMPRIGPHIDEMKKRISSTGIDIKRINIKAKTDEGMGPVGRCEGMAAYAVCLLEAAT